jgi:hypothetical protein
VTPALWVARLIISDATKKKLSVRHGLDWRDVTEALVGARGLRYLWDDDSERGRRAIVQIRIGGRRCEAVLYPVDDPMGGVWALGSAYPR